MRSIKVLAGAVALLAGVQTVQAQTQMSVEVRGGVGIPTGDWNDEDLLEDGYGLGFDVRAQVTPQIGVYAGYEMVVFGADEEVLDAPPGVDIEATDAGFRAGVELNVPLASAPSVTPFLQAGIIYNSLEISVSDGDASEEAESEESLGFEAGVGLTVRVGPRLDVVPSIRFRQHEIEYEDFGAGTEDAQYVLISVGLRFRI